MDEPIGVTARSGGRHTVLLNGDGQYAIWPGRLPIPIGWRSVYAADSRRNCLAEIEERRPGTSPAGAAATGDTIHQLFRARVARDPRAVAVVAEDGEIDYRELDLRSDRLAGRLRALGAGPGGVLPICLPRGIDLVIALLAVLKAGAAFLPLDPDHPDRRLNKLVVDCGAELLITDREHGPRFTDGPAVLLVDEPLVDEPRDVSAGSAASVPDAGRPSDPAYLIYTSGTTGTPKGVLVTHGSLLFTLARVTEAYELSPADRVLQLAALGFDTSLEQIFATLLSGATLVLGGSPAWAPSEALERLPRLGVTVADLTPAYWHQLLTLLPEHGPGLPGLRLLIVGGDTVPAEDCRRSLRRLPGTRLVNAYGLTEAAVTSTLCELTAELLDTVPSAPVPIGRPLPGVRLYLLDADLRPVPPGERGEIHLGGPGLAHGYWQRLGLTAECFLPDPFADVPGERMYRTGDAGRLRPDGNLELLGRFDDQVKVRGFRVDPVEIESVLASHPAVLQVRVRLEETGEVGANGRPGDGARVLTAYCTVADGETVEVGAVRAELRRHLAARLPEFMVPARFVLLDRMPLTPAGKIDRHRLPHVEPLAERRAVPVDAGPVDGSAGRAAVARTAVARLWSEVLGVEEVRQDDDFFALGGNSLLLMEMLARARSMFGIEVTGIRALTRALLRDAGIGAFTAAIEAARAGSAGAGRSVDLAAEVTLADVPIRTSALPRPRRERPAELLLTGATGFCGAHLLDTLLTGTDARIHCLVRADDERHARERLRAAHQRFLHRDLTSDRVVPLVGDLTAPLLGLDEQRFDQLADSLDGIHHLGGQVNFLYPYHQLREANVGATREVIRLAGRSRGIPVHYVSTLAVLAGFGAAGVPAVTEETPLDHAQHLAVGYVESKWVAESLLHRAAEAGLPVTIVRTNDVTGDLVTGTMNTATELCALVKYLADTGSCPQVRLPLDFVPADRFSQALAHLAAHAPAGGDVYHLANPRPVLLDVLAERLRVRGYPIEEIPYQDWVSELVRFAAAHPTHPLTPFVPLFVDRCPGTELSISELYFRPTFPEFDSAKAELALRDSGIELPPVDDELIDHYLDRMLAAGWIPAPAGVPAELSC
ncbi:amino acid adenylation domain-containing protein [Kitasatospora sp. NPDC052896]|uniref:amino acid adenylation domain-containing protein n=1 Tax=Kitasatospora sp. NPDC052896 TaxID=3364061 RepID=UPI0037C5AA60